MAIKIFLIICFAGIASAGDLSHYARVVKIVDPHFGHETFIPNYEIPSKYEFSYGVHDSITGDVKSAEETRVGDTVTGTYSLVDPDGFKRTVDYHADAETGFKAEVRREPIVHPQPIVHKYARFVSPVVEKVRTVKTRVLPSYLVDHPDYFDYQPVFDY